MTKLQAHEAMTTTLAHPDEWQLYYFDLAPNQVATVTFTAPSFEYMVMYDKEEYPLEKGDGADAHEGPTIDFNTTQTFTFTEATKHRIYLIITSAIASVLPSASYTIGLTVDGV